MRNTRYRAYIRSLACCICEVSRGVEAAHTGPHGLGQKSSDYSCIPLCKRHHRAGNDSIHSLGPHRFAAQHQLDLGALVARLNAQGLLIRGPHAIGRKQRSPEFTRYHCPCGWRTAWYRQDSAALAAMHNHLEDRS